MVHLIAVSNIFAWVFSAVTDPASLLVIGQIIYYGLLAAATGFGIYQKIRRGQVEQALDLTDKALETVVAGLERASKLPGHEQWANTAKEIIKGIALKNGVEREKLAGVVSDITSRLSEMGILDEPRSLVTSQQLADAIEVARQERQGRRVVSTGAGAALILLLLVLPLASCSAGTPVAASPPPDSRLTSEVIMDGELIVLYPKGFSTKPSDYVTVPVTPLIMGTMVPLPESRY